MTANARKNYRELMNKHHHHYSGNGSKTFWSRVNRLKDEIDHTTVYTLGVALQNHEEFVLRILENAEQKLGKRKR